MIIVNGWKPLTVITKCSILDVAAVLDPPLIRYVFKRIFMLDWFKSGFHPTWRHLRRQSNICTYFWKHKITEKLIQFIGLQARQHDKYSRLVDKIKLFLLNCLDWHFGKKKYLFSVNKKEKLVIISAQSLYSFCNKIEEYS